MSTDSVSNSSTASAALQKFLEKSSTSTSTSTSSSSSTRTTGEMGKDDFLNLLITQLKYQDPMNPTDDKEFIGQMAQFSALEQSQNLNTSLSSIKGMTYLGKNIKAEYTDSTTQETKDVSGVVSDVKLTSTGVVAIVGSNEVPVDKITEITQDGVGSATTQDISKYSGYIGYKAKGTYTDSDNNNLSVEGIVREIKKGTDSEEAVLDNATLSIINVDSTPRLTSIDDKKSYLDSKVGQSISVKVSDDTGKYMMSVTGKLESYQSDDSGNIKVTLGGITIPVKTIGSVTNPSYTE